MTGFDWTEDAIQALRRMWAEGLSTAAIGRRLGCGKNAVIGKAYRLDLPPRPQPVRGRWPEGHVPASPRGTQAGARGRAGKARAVATPWRDGAPPRRFLTCQWIEGDVRQPGWRFCSTPTRWPGDPWCHAHAARVFVQPRQPQHEAA